MIKLWFIRVNILGTTFVLMSCLYFTNKAFFWNINISIYLIWLQKKKKTEKKLLALIVCIFIMCVSWELKPWPLMLYKHSYIMCFEGGKPHTSMFLFPHTSIEWVHSWNSNAGWCFFVSLKHLKGALLVIVKNFLTNFNWVDLNFNYNLCPFISLEFISIHYYIKHLW